MTTFTISDTEIDKFLKGNLTKIPNNTIVVVDPQKIGEFMELVRKNFGSISQEQFNWIQNLIPNLDNKALADGHTLADHISNMFRSGFKHSKRNDLICHLKKDSVTKFHSIECFGGDTIQKMPPQVFQGMSSCQIKSLINSSSVKFLTDEQKNVIIANNRVNKDLKSKLYQSTSIITPMADDTVSSVVSDDQRGGIPLGKKQQLLPELFVEPTSQHIKKKSNKTLPVTRSPSQDKKYVLRKKNDGIDEISLRIPTTDANYRQRSKRSIRGGDDEDDAIIVENVNSAELVNEFDPNIETETEGNIINEIQEHIKNMEIVDGVDFPLENENLTVNGIDVSAECFVHFFMDVDRASKDACAAAHMQISRYFDGDNLDVIGLLGTSQDLALSDALSRAKEIYSFIVSVVRKTTEEKFKSATPENKHQVLKKIEDMIVEYFNFTHKLMDKHKVIDIKIVRAAEDMLYLYTNVIKYHTNVGKNFGALTETYADLLAAVQTNIDLYNGLQTGTIIGSENIAITPDMSATVASLLDRMTELKEQQDLLTQNIQMIDQESVRSGQNASTTMKNFVDKLQ